MSTRPTSPYRKFNVAYHDDDRFLSMTPLAKLVFYHMLARSNRIGLFRVKVASEAEDLGISRDAFMAALNEVVAAMDWRYDDGHCVLFISDWWRDNRPENANVVIAASRDLARVPHASPLISEWFGRLDICIDGKSKVAVADGSTRVVFLSQLLRECAQKVIGIRTGTMPTPSTNKTGELTGVDAACAHERETEC